MVVADKSIKKNNACLDIILASYNGQTYISDQLRSLQRCADYTERVKCVLVVDDASEDNTAHIVAQFSEQDPRIVWIPSLQGRQGVVANFARGLSLSAAPYVMLCDQDDVWNPDKIRLQLELCHKHEKSYGEGEPLLIFADLQVVDEDLQVLSPSFFSYQKIAPEWAKKFRHLLIQNVAPGCTLLLNRPLIDKALPIPPQAVMHDWWLILVARAFGQILWLDQPLVQYRQHGGNQVGAKRISWQWIFSLRERCQMATENLILQGVQAKIFRQRYGNDLNLQIDKREYVALEEVGQLSDSTIWQRLCCFFRGNLRKNSVLRNLGLLLVLVVWSGRKDDV